MTARRALPFLALLALLVTLPACSAAEAQNYESPDQAIEAMSRGLADGRPEVLWHSLPESYQSDVTSLIHESAGEMDAELWNSTFRVLRKVTRLLGEKRQFILDHPMVAGQVKDGAEAERDWEAVVELFDVLVNSELSDLDELRELDVEEFLAGTCARFMKQIQRASELSATDGYGESMAKLRATKAKVIDSSGDATTVEITRPGVPATQEKWVRVEGKWLPARVVDTWSREIADARTRLAEFAGKDSENKQMVLMQLAMAEGAVDTLLAASTADQFNAGLASVLGMVMSAAMSQAGNSAPEVSMSMPPSESAQPTPPMPGVLTVTPLPKTMPNLPPTAGTSDPAPVRRAAAGNAEKPLTRRASSTLIEFDEVDRYLDQILQVTYKDGREIKGRLSSVRGDILVIERELASGSMTFELTRNEIAAIDILVQ